MAVETDIPSPSTRRGRRILRQRKEIMDAAARLFALNGYAATTTKDIAAAADIGESTLYGYFPGKRDVLLAIFSQQAGEIDAFLAQIGALSGRDSFVEFGEAMIARIMDNAVTMRALIAEAWVSDEILNRYVIERLRHVNALLEKFVAERIAAGAFRPFDPATGARILTATFLSALLPALRGVEPPPTPAQRRVLAENVIDLLLYGAAVR
jgi:AcrR family transcriptional regulator